MTLLSLLVLTAQLVRVTPERVVWAGKFPELGEGTFLLDFESRRFARATDAELQALSQAKPIAIREERVEFRNADVKLVGKLTLPETNGPHPAIVLIHGSNDEDRDYLDPWVGFFVSRGMAVLSYDKRGVRESTGDWKRADFHDLAGDVRAAVQFLRRQKSIDAKRIGLMGFSQGGWIAPIVASKDRGIAFIILHAGSGLPVAENGLLYVDSLLRGYGFPADEIEKAMAYYRLNDEVTRHPERFRELQELFDKSKIRKVEWLIEDPQAPDFWFRSFYRKIMDFDPAPFWPQVRCPILAFLGEADHNVPPEPNRTALAAALKKNRDATIVVLPKANHLFLDGEQFADGYFNAMDAWLSARHFHAFAIRR